MESIKNVFCIGRNYTEHVKELHNKQPDQPVVFSKPTHSLILANNNVVALPENRGDIHYEVELVIKLARDYTKGSKVDDIVDEMALGIDLTMREVQDELKKQRYPWLISKGFPNSAIVSKFIKFPGEQACTDKQFSLFINEQEVQSGNISEMIFDLNEIIEFIGLHTGLKKGDVIFTGTPAGVGPLKDEDHLALKWGKEELGSCVINFN